MKFSIFYWWSLYCLAGNLGYFTKASEKEKGVVSIEQEEHYENDPISENCGRVEDCDGEKIDKATSHLIIYGKDNSEGSECKLKKDKNGNERRRINIPQGELEGIRASTGNGVPYWSFRGIPYAKPPLGNLRFKAPVFPDKFNSLYDATMYRPACPHIAPDKVTFLGNEDCLHIYINVRSINETRLSPVIVYFNGGMFRDIRPHSELEVDALMESDNIVHVNFYYRLNILGLLSLETKDVPGNTLFKDQVMALRWVKNNIKHFGGDSNNVMIWGHSSGGTAVYLHLTSPMSKGLFNKAVIHSGTLVCQWRWDQDNAGTVIKVAQRFGFNKSTDPDEIMDYLQKKSVEELVRTTFDIEGKDNFQDMRMSPVIEKVFHDTEQFMPMSPTAAYKNQLFNDVPIILTYTSKEIRYGDKAGVFFDHPDYFLRPTSWILGTEGDKPFDVYKEEVLNYYFDNNNKQIDWNDMDNLETAINIAGDIFHVIPTIDTANIIKKYSTKPVYLMRFAHRDSLNLPYVDIFGLQGASHVDEIRYVFVNGIQIEPRSSTDYIHKRIIALIMNFARYSDPNPAELDNLLPVKWLPMTNRTSYYMGFSGELTLGNTLPEQNRFEFWQKLEQRLYSEAGCNQNWRDICSMTCS